MSVDEDMAATNTRTHALEVGSAQLAASPQGRAVPAGTTHLVEGWEPICGGGRVRFVFPGRVVDLPATCPDCAQAVAPTSVPVPVPRQRAATRPTARTRKAS